jgi:hypothetical protein
MSIERAESFCDNINDPECYVVLGKAQLDVAKAKMEQNIPLDAVTMIRKAGTVFIRARDGSQYKYMIKTVFSFARDFKLNYSNEVAACYNILIDYLRQARTVVFVGQKYAEHAEIDTGLMYCYVMLDKLEELEQFLQLVNAATQAVPNKGDVK